MQSNETAHEMMRTIDLQYITESMIDECMDEIPIEVDRDYIRNFILNGQSVIREIIEADEGLTEDDDGSIGMML